MNHSDVIGHPIDNELKYIIDSFLVRYKPSTCSTYGLALRSWFKWCEINGIDPKLAKRGHIQMWIKYLMDDLKLLPSTTNTHISAVKGMYSLAYCDNVISADPTLNLKRMNIEFVSTTNALSRAELADLLKVAEAKGTMEYALICLLSLNGLRIGECLAIDVEHLGFDKGYRTLFLPNRKGGKVGILSLSTRTAWAIQIMLGERTSGPLLLGKNGERLHVAAARRSLRSLCSKIGVTKKISPHSLRHSFVTLSLDAGVPERDIIDSTGHASGEMIRYYDRNRGGIERNATHVLSAFVGAAG